MHRRDGHGADIPEELRMLLEDACIAQDLDAASRLFENGAVLALTGAAVSAPRHIARAWRYAILVDTEGSR